MLKMNNVVDFRDSIHLSVYIYIHRNIKVIESRYIYIYNKYIYLDTLCPTDLLLLAYCPASHIGKSGKMMKHVGQLGGDHHLQTAGLETNTSVPYRKKSH